MTGRDGASGAPDVAAAASALRARLGGPVRAAVVLGSGLGGLVDRVDDPVSVPFEDLPGFPPSGVAGHEGRFVGGRLGGCPVLLQAGRYHVYEGHPLDVVVAPIRVAAALGVDTVVLTNAAGGADPELEPGQVVLLTDHVNLMGRNPLIGPAGPGEPRFPDMREAYDADLRERARATARRLGLSLREGIYAAVTGPSFETPAEVRMIRALGADVIGMSTVPEVLVARALGLRCLAFSMVANKGTGYTERPLLHEEVMAVGREAGAHVARLIEGVLASLDAPQSGDAK